MPSTSTVILQYVCPALGVIVGNFMFAAPIKSVQTALSKGTLGDINPTPWAFMTGNCCGWLAYSFLKQDYFIFAGNAPGLVLSIWLNMYAVALEFQDHHGEKIRDKNMECVKNERSQEPSGAAEPQRVPDESDLNIPTRIPELDTVLALNMPIKTPKHHDMKVLTIVTTWVIIGSIVSFVPMGQSEKELVIGILVNINLMFFYGAPLSTIFRVIKTRSAASIHVRTMYLNTANGVFWTAYGLSVYDLVIFVPNFIGALLGFAQIFFRLTFPVHIESSGRPDRKSNSSTVSSKGHRLSTISGTVSEETTRNEV